MYLLTRSDKLSGLRSSPIFARLPGEKGKALRENLMERLYSFFPCILCIVQRACWSYEMYELQFKTIKMPVSRNIRHLSRITRTFSLKIKTMIQFRCKSFCAAKMFSSRLRHKRFLVWTQIPDIYRRFINFWNFFLTISVWNNFQWTPIWLLLFLDMKKFFISNFRIIIHEIMKFSIISYNLLFLLLSILFSDAH